MGRKFKFNKLKELHAAIGALIDESDAAMADAEDGPADAHQRNAASRSDPMNHPEPQANDSAAPSDGRTLTMAEGFKGLTVNGPLRR